MCSSSNEGVFGTCHALRAWNKRHIWKIEYDRRHAILSLQSSSMHRLDFLGTVSSVWVCDLNQSLQCTPPIASIANHSNKLWREFLYASYIFLCKGLTRSIIKFLTRWPKFICLYCYSKLLEVMTQGLGHKHHVQSHIMHWVLSSRRSHHGHSQSQVLRLELHPHSMIIWTVFILFIFFVIDLQASHYLQIKCAGPPN